jgi:senataxin
MAILAAARVKAQQQQEPPLPPQQGPPKKKSSPRVARKHAASAAGTASSSSSSSTFAPKLLSQLVQNVTTTASLSNMDPSASSLAPIHPDDFWKKLREWDVLTQFAQQQNSDINISSNNNNNQSKPLPDTFINARHYMAAWAPLCIAECRAQLMQEIPYATKGILVQCTTTATGGRRSNHGGNSRQSRQDSLAYYDLLNEHDETAMYIQLNLIQGSSATTTTSVSLSSNNNRNTSNNDNNSGSNGSGTFTPNDLVLLLIPSQEYLLRDLASSSSSSSNKSALATRDYSTAGLLGHVEQGKASLNGLVIKVSKRKWAQIGQAKMIAIPWKGGNITALREYTALCRMETLPLKRYLLGHHLVNGTSKKQLHTLNSQQLLDRMGGGEALGKGFVAYATKKFNASQLTAIAASANQYGDGGFTLIKGPPGTGKTTTLVAILNSLHIRQYNKYYEEVRRIAALPTGARSAALELARKAKPRLLCCAPSNTAVDNIIVKIMEDGFIDGKGQRYNPSIIRVGVGQSAQVRAVALETKVDSILSDHMDAGKLETSIAGYRSELSRITSDIARLRKRCYAITSACPWPLSREWEIRINEETFDEQGGVFFVNHKEQSTTFEVPPPPEPGETQFQANSMPEYRAYMARIVKLVENYFSVKTYLERCTIVKGATDNGANHFEIQQNMENHVLNSVHIVMTTLGSAGGRALEGVDKFEVVVIDEAAQSVEPQSLSALQLGNRHAVLVGDPQQLPATIFNISGKNTKYDRSLFQRLEEAGEPVYMLNEQYRMHPKISHFPRHIFYDGTLLDGPNVKQRDYGNPLLGLVCRTVPKFHPFTIIDLDSSEERGGTSLANPDEAELAVYLYMQLKEVSRGLSTKSRVAVITPYAQQSKLLRRYFETALGPRYTDLVEVNTVDAFQGREANIVIFSAVRASGSKGIGFLADVRRMNVALTRAKHMLFVIARCESIVVNPYWRDLVEHARETNAVVRVPMKRINNTISFGSLNSWESEVPLAEQRDNAPVQLESCPPASKAHPSDPRKAVAQKPALSEPHRSDPRQPISKPIVRPDKPIDPRRRVEANNTPTNPSDSDNRKRDVSAATAAPKPIDPRKRGRGYPL